MCMSILVWVFAACSRYLKNEFHADAKWPMILELKHCSYYKRRLEAEWKPASLGDFLVERDDMLEWMLSLILGEMSSTEIGKSSSIDCLWEMSNFSENDLKKLEAVRGKEHRNHRPPTPRNVEGSACCVVLELLKQKLDLRCPLPSYM